MTKILSIILIASLFVFGCSSVTQEYAEETALGFIDQNVKFYTRGDNDSQNDVAGYSVDSIDSFEQNGVWVVNVHITTPTENGTKSNDLVVSVGPKGNVLSLNGQQVR